MPKKAHDALVKEALKKGYKRGSDAFNRYVYGTLNRIEGNKKKKGKK